MHDAIIRFFSSSSAPSVKRPEFVAEMSLEDVSGRAPTGRRDDDQVEVVIKAAAAPKFVTTDHYGRIANMAFMQTIVLVMRALRTSASEGGRDPSARGWHLRGGGDVTTPRDQAFATGENYRNLNAVATQEWTWAAAASRQPTQFLKARL